MIAGKGTPDQAPARLTAYRDPAFMAALIDRLVRASTAYLIRQIDAGAEAVQIFESFGSALPPALFDRSVARADPAHGGGPEDRAAAREGHRVRPGRRRASSSLRCRRHRRCARPRLDPRSGHVLPTLPGHVATQGNLDPLALIAGGEALDKGVDHILAAVRAVRTSSIWGTASCRRRRSSTCRS